MINILIADDEERTQRILSDFLKKEGFNVLIANNGQEAIDIFEEKYEMINLVILDIFMPVSDGWSVLRHIRRITDKTPVMMLTESTGNSDKSFGFEEGADDYITKPISPIVLIARVKALLKSSLESQLNAKHEFDGLVIDEIGHSVYLNDVLLDLSPKEYDLLVYLAKNAGIAMSREQLINIVWGYDYFGDLRTLDTHVKNLRAKLGEKGEYIKTVRGYGYKFEEQC